MKVSAWISLAIATPVVSYFIRSGLLASDEVQKAAQTVVEQSPARQKAQGSETEHRISVSTASLNTTHRLIGPLGKPVGEVITAVLTVEDPRSKDGHLDVAVTHVNGERLPAAVSMNARLWTHGSNIQKLVPGKTMTVRAYQDAGMTGIPSQAMRETVTVQTTGYRFACWLMILKEIEAAK